MTTTPEQIAAGLSKAQQAYILAHSGAEYYARHGVTANWALRHGYAQIMVHTADGQYLPWKDTSPDLLFNPGTTIGGQILTPLGLAVRAIIKDQPNDQ